MDTHDRTEAQDSHSQLSEKPFRLIAIYDSSEANAEARYVSEVVLRELGDDIDVARTSWDLRLLKQSSLRTLAADEAARADVIVIALGEDTPSDGFKLWMDEWQCKREMEGGLIAFVPSGRSQSGGDLAEYVYEVAVSAQMDFLCRKKRRF